MGIFALRDRLIEEYRRYVRGFVVVKEGDVRRFVDDHFNRGELWPEPLVQLNPSVEPGRSIDELVRQGVLHPECRNTFRRRDTEHSYGRPIVLQRHQAESLAAAASGRSYVLTTGTGSGKSLTYFITIVDYVPRNGPGKAPRRQLPRCPAPYGSCPGNRIATGA